MLRVTDLQTRESVEVPAGATLLAAIEYSGKQTVPVGCRNGGCGACRVRVLSGTFVAGAMSRRYVSAEELAQGFALACKLTPASDLEFVCAPMAPRPARNQPVAPVREK